ncbi:hypothetical protein [Bartonella sp. HY038]|uniref:hypothetical protein n=1 Tax=Bartonella sp. HY038 TaxID=2759660 RepID=UPI0015FCBDC8|nr:hypothetical protein [Bartonella sp. HY038]
MSELKDNILDIELPVKKIRLTYLSNLGLILVLTFWTLLFSLFFIGPVLIGSYYPIKRLWNDWVISNTYEVIPNRDAQYSCYEHKKSLNYYNCEVTFNVNNRFEKEELNFRVEQYPYSWHSFLTPDDLVLNGLSPMVRSVDDPSRTSFLFGIETIKIRLLNLIFTKLFQLTFVAVCFYGLYVWWDIY